MTNRQWDAYTIRFRTSLRLKLQFTLHSKEQKGYYWRYQTMQNQIQGINRGYAVKWKETWKFSIEDNDVIERTIEIPYTNYCKDSPYHLLSPQHWSQQSKHPPGTYCNVSHEQI